MNIKSFNDFLNESADSLLTTKESIAQWLDSEKIKNYTINDDLTVDVKGNVDLSYRKFKKFPVKFGKVSGGFYCFVCTSLVSLEGAPQEIGGDFYCYDCTSLVSLEGAPRKVGGYFNCYDCTSLVSLEGAPQEVGGRFICNGCTSLVSLKGAPQEVGGGFSCENTPIESIIDAFGGFENYINTPEDQRKPKLIELAKQRKIEWSLVKHLLTKDELKKYTGGIYREKFGI